MPDVLLLRPGEAAEILGVSRSTIYSLIQEGRLPAVKLGRRGVRVHRAELERRLEREARGESTKPAPAA